MSVRSCGHDNDGDNGLTQEYKLMRIAWLVTCSDSPRRRPIWQASTVSLCLSRFAHHQMLKRIVFLHHQHVSTKCIYPGMLLQRQRSGVETTEEIEWVHDSGEQVLSMDPRCVLHMSRPSTQLVLRQASISLKRRERRMPAPTLQSLRTCT